MTGTPITYKDAGVDIELGDTASSIMYEASKFTWKNRAGLAGEVQCTHDLFSALRLVDVSRFPDALMGMNFDGVGTKMEIAERVGDFSTVAFDLMAMVCDDAVIKGGEPILIGSIVDCNKLSVQMMKGLANGMIAAARDARVAVINGEVAELGDRVKGFGVSCCNWGAAAVWIGRSERMLSSAGIRPGQTVVAKLHVRYL